MIKQNKLERGSMIHSKNMETRLSNSNSDSDTKM